MMALLNFGDFRVDLEAHRIYTAAGELAIEPKVIDVLCYLIENSERIVSLQELHDEVWTGRVVTDTAVRRAISKLRAALGDVDPDAPLYIRSQIKRGYQFIGQPLPADVSKADSISIAPADDVVIQPVLKISFGTTPKGAPFWYGMLSVVVLVLLCCIFIYETSENTVLTTEPLVSIVGEKHFLSVSANGRYQAFTGRLNKNEGWQPFLYDRQLGHLQKMGRPLNANFPFVSVLHNDTVIVSTVADGESQLHLYAITNLNRLVKTIKLKDFSRIGQVVLYQDNVVLMNGQKNDEKNFVYYLLDLEDETIKQFTFSSLQKSIDFNAALSPDKKHFALVRRGADYQVQVLRAGDKTLLAEETFDFRMVPADEVNLVWLDTQQLLINGGEKFTLLNIASGTKIELPVSERFSSLGRDNAGNLFALLKQPAKSNFYQVQLNDLNSIQRYFSFPGQAVSLSYSHTSNKLWLVEKNINSYQLHLYQPDTGDKKFYFKSNEPFTVIEDEHDTTYLLLSFNNKQLKMLDHTSGTLTDISDVNQKIGFPTFGADKNVIFFAEQIGDEWQVNAVDRKSLTQSTIVKGYRLLLPWNQQFIVADAKGDFYLLDKRYQLVKQLQLKIDFNLLHQVSLHGNKLIAANIGVDSYWRLTTLDLVSEQYQQQQTNTLPIKTTFSFNTNGSSVLVTADNSIDNQLVKVGYSLGYN